MEITRICCEVVVIEGKCKERIRKGEIMEDEQSLWSDCSRRAVFAKYEQRWWQWEMWRLTSAFWTGENLQKGMGWWFIWITIKIHSGGCQCGCFGNRVEGSLIKDVNQDSGTKRFWGFRIKKPRKYVKPECGLWNNFCFSRSEEIFPSLLDVKRYLNGTISEIHYEP